MWIPGANSGNPPWNSEKALAAPAADRFPPLTLGPILSRLHSPRWNRFLALEEPSNVVRHLQNATAKACKLSLQTTSGVLIDGRNRWEPCKRAGIKPEVSVLDGQDAVSYILSANIHRRNLNKGQIAMMITKAYPQDTDRKVAEHKELESRPAAVLERASGVPARQSPPVRPTRRRHWR